MRATNLGFRSPKEKTAEFNYPVVTFDGRVLPILHCKRHPTFPRSRRFSQYDIEARRTGRAGPGDYNLIQQPGIEWRIKGTPLYKDLHGKKDTSDNGFLLVGASMLYEPSFVLRKRRSLGESSANKLLKEPLRKSTSVKDAIVKDKNTTKFTNKSKASVQSKVTNNSRIKSAVVSKRRIQRKSDILLKNSPYFKGFPRDLLVKH